MKSIREAAMSKEEPKKTFASSYPADNGMRATPNYNGYGEDDWGIDEMFPKSNYTPPNPKAIFITFKLQYTEIGPESDPDNDLWNENIAETKAIEIAYDKVEELLGKGFESKYSVCFKASDNFDDYELEVELTPIN